MLNLLRFADHGAPGYDAYLAHVVPHAEAVGADAVHPRRGLIRTLGCTPESIYAPGPEPRLGVPTVAGTMAFVTFVSFQVFNLLNVRSDVRSAFGRETLENRSAFIAATAVVVLLVLIVEMDVLHGFMTVTDLTSGQWLACVAIGSAILWVGELVKIVLRARAKRARATTALTPSGAARP